MQVGKYKVRDGLSKFMYQRVQITLADAAGIGSNRAYYDAAMESAPYMIEGGEGVPPLERCKIAGVTCIRVNPDWLAENLDIDDAMQILNECLRASEVTEQEVKN